MLLGVAAPPPLICLDPGHGTPPAIGRQVEPIGPGSSQLKIKDGGGARGRGEGRARDRLADAERAGPARLPRGDDAHGAVDPDRHPRQHRAGAVLQPPARGADAAHPRGRLDRPGQHGASTLYPALHPGWTDDIYARSRRAARLRPALGGRGDRRRRPRPRRALGPDGLQLGERPRRARGDGVRHEPAARRRCSTRPATSARVASGLAAGVAAAVPSRR